MSQESGLLGKLVGGMIRRTVRARFRNVYWRVAPERITQPAIFYANHHGWHDGYLMYHVVKALKAPSVDWITEFDAFPLFRTVGGMRFPKGDVAARAVTMRRTLRMLAAGEKSLILFPEAHLHAGPCLLPFDRFLERAVLSMPHVAAYPVAIRYEMGVHERPEAWISVGNAVTEGFESALEMQLHKLTRSIAEEENFDVLVRGTGDVNERWDMRRMPR
jgi:1-acyl-sn-glycerol-3-phosphate acyltransferase